MGDGTRLGPECEQAKGDADRRGSLQRGKGRKEQNGPGAGVPAGTPYVPETQPFHAHQSSGRAPALRVFQMSAFISEIPLKYGLLVQLDEGGELRSWQNAEEGTVGGNSQ